MKLRLLAAGIVTLFITAQSARAADFRVPTLGDALLRAGNPTIPAAWSGIWAFEDSTHLCSDPMVIFTSTGFDTLCTGGSIEEGQGGIPLDCTGTVDDNSVDVTCTGTDDSDPLCIIHYSFHLVANRNGDSFFAESTIDVTYEPSGCDFDQCIVTETTATRTGPEPPGCLTPVEPSTWGTIKAQYR
jgi:hypothetical protein